MDAFRFEVLKEMEEIQARLSDLITRVEELERVNDREEDARIEAMERA